MYCVKKVTEDLYWIGASDRRLALFENIYPIPQGVSYNSYLLSDEKTVLLDTVDKAVSYGKDGGVFSRYMKLRKLKKEKVVISENIRVDQEQATAILKERAVPIADHAQDAAITRTGTGFSIEEEKEGTTVDVEKSIAALEEYLNSSWNHKDFTKEMILKKAAELSLSI